MRLRTLAFLLLPLVLVCAKEKKGVIPTARGENQDIIVYVTLYPDRDAVKELLGSDLDGHYIVADVKIEPKFGKEVAIDRGDFVLRTDKDGEKAQPFAPTQIAGRGSLVIRQTAGGGGMMGESGGPMIGMPGPMGGPMGYPGGGGTFGNGGSGDVGGAEAKADNGSKEKENPLLKVLQQKILPEKKTDQPVAGLLYFPMEKQKVKDLELTFGGRENRITMRFK
jgi:hypothetical protein